jgi:probable HAF family extracellular repeat protein
MKAALTAVAVGILVAAIAGAGGPNPKPTPSPSPSSSPPPAAAAYSITDLGSLGGGYTVGLAINDNGQVTGYSSIAKTIPTGGCCGNCYGGGHRIPCTTHPTHAFVWSNGTMTDLGTLGGNYSQGLSINLSGQVVGSADTGTGSSSFLWNGTKMTALSGLGAYWINDSGQIAGACTDSTGSYPCVDSNGKFTRLPQPSNPAVSCGGASAINNNGQAIGTCGDTSSNEHAVLWQNGTATDLGSFGGPNAVAAAINDLGQVAGYAMTSTYAQHGFLWSNGTMTDLGDNFISAAVNDSGVVVWGDLIYSGGTVQNLNNLIPAGSGYQITYAKGINDKGQIIAEAGDSTLLLTPN